MGKIRKAVSAIEVELNQNRNWCKRFGGFKTHAIGLKGKAVMVFLHSKRRIPVTARNERFLLALFRNKFAEHGIEFGEAPLERYESGVESALRVSQLGFRRVSDYEPHLDSVFPHVHTFTIDFRVGR